MEDRLVLTGINRKGFGIIPKLVMCDHNLTPEAKAIYAYLVSFAGNGNTAFPGFRKIQTDLCLSINTYYKHYNLLLCRGYISVTQEHSNGGRGHGFGKNIYTIVSNIVTEKTEDKMDSDHYAILKSQGIRSKGYGMIPKLFMEDRRIPIKAKAVYAYFCSLAGAGNSIVPSKDTILYSVGLSDKTYRDCMKVLTEYGYIEVSRERENGKFQSNIIELKDTIEETCPVSDSQKLPCGKSCESQKKAPCGKKSETQKEEENKNNLKSKQFSIYPNEGKSDRRKVQEYIYSITPFGQKLKNGGFEIREEMESEILFTEALTDLLTSQRSYVGGNEITPEDVEEKIEKYTEIDENGTKTITTIALDSINDYHNGTKNKTVKNTLGYMKSCIWQVMKTGNSYLSACIRHDFQ